MKITNKSLIFSILFVGFYVQGISQTLGKFVDQDCRTAITVCEDIIVQPHSYTGDGFVHNEINPQVCCLGNGEDNSVWYSYTVAASGMLNFSIIPNIANNDYDWAVFNITQSSCEEIYHDTSLVLSCNFAPTPGPTGPNGNNDPQCMPEIPVLAGDHLAIIITNFSIANAGGFILDFSQSTANYTCTLNITESNQKDVIIYPNPADDIYNIQLGKTYDNINIKIYSMSGLILQEAPAYNTDHISIEHGLAAGVYLIRINIENQILSKKLIVK